jgi:hypothetical protein
LTNFLCRMILAQATNLYSPKCKATVKLEIISIYRDEDFQPKLS